MPYDHDRRRTGRPADGVLVTGTLYWWNCALTGGLGAWQLAATSIEFTATANGKDFAILGSFGIHIDNAPIAARSATLPNSAPIPLKGGRDRGLTCVSGPTRRLGQRADAVMTTTLSDMTAKVDSIGFVVRSWIQCSAG